MAENETVSAIDADSKSMLEEHVKKGKARKFIMLCKGASIETLIVFKKGPYGTKLTQAKKAGFRGVAYCGVISGKGANVELQLPGNDAVSKAMGTEGNVYDSEPCKIAKLRDFFAVEADLKLKPTISIITAVDQVFSVSESEADESESETDEVETQEEAATTAHEQPESESETDEVETQEEATLTTDEQPGSGTARQALVDAMKKLLPTVQQAIQSQPTRKAEILAPTTEFNTQLKQGDFDAAKQTLTRYVVFLKGILSNGSAGDAGAAWREASAKLEPRYLAVLAGQPANATALRAVWEYCGEQAAAAKYPAALAGLARLEKLLNEALQPGAAKETDVIPEGIVAQTARKLEALRDTWREVRVRSVEGLSDLLGVLQLSNDQELIEIGNRVDTLSKAIPAQLEPSLAALGAAVQSNDAAQIKSQKSEVQAGLKQCAEYLKQNQQSIDCCENNPFGVVVSVRQPLAQSLREISASLQTL